MLETELKVLQHQLLEMAGIAERMLHQAVESVLTRKEVLAHAVVATDDTVDSFENQIEATCIQLIALHQPVAFELRFLTAAMKICRNIERIADKSVGIAKRSIELLAYPPLLNVNAKTQHATTAHAELRHGTFFNSPPLSNALRQYKKSADRSVFVDLPYVAQLIQEMVKDALDAFVNRNAELAREIRERDSEVDAIYARILPEILAVLGEHPNLIHPGISVLLLFRHLERVGDLSANIGEEVYYLVKGDVIRHHNAS